MVFTVYDCMLIVIGHYAKKKDNSDSIIGDYDIPRESDLRIVTATKVLRHNQ